MNDLHAAIMNLVCDVPQDCTPTERLHFKAGHKDARHAAAELVQITHNAQASEIATLRKALETAQQTIASMIKA